MGSVIKLSKHELGTQLITTGGGRLPALLELLKAAVAFLIPARDGPHSSIS